MQRFQTVRVTAQRLILWCGLGIFIEAMGFTSLHLVAIAVVYRHALRIVRAVKVLLDDARNKLLVLLNAPMLRRDPERPR